MHGGQIQVRLGLFGHCHLGLAVFFHGRTRRILCKIGEPVGKRGGHSFDTDPAQRIGKQPVQIRQRRAEGRVGDGPQGPNPLEGIARTQARHDNAQGVRGGLRTQARQESPLLEAADGGVGQDLLDTTHPVGRAGPQGQASQTGAAFGTFQDRFDAAILAVAVGTDVGRTQLPAGDRIGDPEAVIPPGIDPHVGPLGHVAGFAADLGRMQLVHRHLLHLSGVAGHAQRIPGQLAQSRVRVVTVTACHSLLRHSALQEGSVDIDLIQDLTVGEVEPVLYEGWGELVEERLAVRRGLDERRTPRVARGAHGKLGLQHPVIGAPIDRKAGGCRAGHPVRFARILQVVRTRPVTGFTTHCGLGPGGFIGIAGHVIALFKRRGMTRGAHVIPAQPVPLPIQYVSLGRGLVRIE